MSRKIHPLCSLALFTTALALATIGCGQHGMSPPEKVTLNGIVTVPMESVEGRLVISAKLDGRGPYKFILDSGSEVSLLADTFAREANLPAVGEMQVGSPGSKTPKTAAVVAVGKLEIGGLAAESFTMLAMDLTGLQKRVPGLVGVISAQMFDGLLVSYDYPAGQMQFRRGALRVADDRMVFDWPRGQRKPSIVMDIAGESVRVDLDSGSQGTFTIAQKYAGKLAWLEAPVEGNPIRLLDTQYKSYRGRLKGTIRFGLFSFENPQLTYHEGPFNNVGYPVLKDFVFTIDPANRRFELRKP